MGGRRLSLHAPEVHCARLKRAIGRRHQVARRFSAMTESALAISVDVAKKCTTRWYSALNTDHIFNRTLRTRSRARGAETKMGTLNGLTVACDAATTPA